MKKEFELEGKIFTIEKRIEQITRYYISSGNRTIAFYDDIDIDEAIENFKLRVRKVIDSVIIYEIIDVDGGFGDAVEIKKILGIINNCSELDVIKYCEKHSIPGIYDYPYSALYEGELWYECAETLDISKSPFSEERIKRLEKNPKNTDEYLKNRDNNFDSEEDILIV